MSAQQTAMLDALAVDPIRQAPLFHALSSVPRAWIATKESPHVHHVDEHAGGMLAPRLCADLLLWLDVERDSSFLNVQSGAGYVNALVAVMQNWTGVNCGSESDAALVEHAQQRVDVFARNSGVGAANRVAFEKEAIDGASFDRVLVSAICPSVTFVQERFMSLLKTDGVLVAPCMRDDGSGTAVAFVRFAKSDVGITTEMRIVSAKSDGSRLKISISEKNWSANWASF
jgi:protein-L-isoaspartate O-methyltransferase